MCTASTLQISKRRVYDLMAVLREVHWVCVHCKNIKKNVHWRNKHIRFLIEDTPRIAGKPVNKMVHEILFRLARAQGGCCENTCGVYGVACAGGYRYCTQTQKSEKNFLVDE